ncbi:divalent-cation tolerance protein CutA [Chloracidobacterium validum]|uniref:Divalent-cation tolerance protein CutA n=1 Tax=Chloracidobacterium validum TaxID=2821543 RepID=A0ABX8BAP6_9BACT|nr:divalent-cation tolerance protein CutA [Chloracidobacterium validum]
MWVVLVTTDTFESARELARLVVQARHAACVNIVPGITSVYQWEGLLREDAECLLILKTTAARYAALEAAIRAHHPYTTPEILALGSREVSPAYAAWVHQACGTEVTT